jgi:protein-tyrosine phosphatase
MVRRTEKASAGYTNWNWITEQVAQGGFPGDPKGLIVTPQIFNVFDVVAFTAQEAIPRGFKPPPGKTAYSCPLDDDPYRPIPHEVAGYAHQFARQLAGHVGRGQKVLVTCFQGVNRSGLITGLTLMYAYGFSGAKTVQIIRSRRKPEGNFMVLGNPMFEGHLRNFRNVRA